MTLREAPSVAYGSTGPGGGPLVRAGALATLNEYIRHHAGAPVPEAGLEDPGPLVLAALLGRVEGPSSREAIAATVRLWATRSRYGGPYVVGLFGGGLAGHLLALTAAADSWPTERALTLRDRNRDRVAAAGSVVPWRPTDVRWSDYDLISGPAGTLLSLATEPAGSPGLCAPIVDRLVALCDSDDLARLRVAEYRDDALHGFNFGRVNTGVGHGVAGVALGLVAADDIGGLPGSGRAALRRIGDWLAAQSIVDGRGVRTWAPVGRDKPPVSPDGIGAARIRGASQRQAWCYGTPGTAWTLWEIGRVLGDDALRGVAIESMASFIAAYDDDFYLADGYPDRVGMCHGGAGLMMISDAFARHAELSGAGELGAQCADFLAARLDRVVTGTATDYTLRSGSTGVFAALLTHWYDGARSWLRAFGLR